MSERDLAAIEAALRDFEHCPDFYAEAHEPCDGMEGCNECLERAAKSVLSALRSSDHTAGSRAGEPSEEVVSLRAQKDGAYRERDACVALIAKLASDKGWRVGMARHEGEWEEDWRWIVYIDLPTGQVSWHIHDSEREWFDFPPYRAKWDGHSLYEKYDRMARVAFQAAARSPTPDRGQRQDGYPNVETGL